MFLKKVPLIGKMLRKMSIRAIKRLIEDINAVLKQVMTLSEVIIDRIVTTGY